MNMLAIVLSLVAVVPQAPSRDQDPGNDPRYEAAVTRLAESLQKLKSYSVDVVVDWKTGDGATGANAYRFRFESPGKFRVEVMPTLGAPATLIVVCDGKAVTTFLPSKALYQRETIDDPSQGMLNNPILATSIKGSLIDSLLTPNLKEYVLERSRKAVLVGQDEIDGRKVEHFRLTWGRDEEDYWLGPEVETLPRRLIRVYHFPGQDEQGLTLTTAANLSWTLNPQHEPSTFKIDLPENARLVPDIEAALTEGTTQNLIGKAAPELSLSRLSGGEGAITGEKGKEVIVLNFWASWCLPSVSTLPGIAKMRDAMLEKGVRVISINVGESPSAAAAFLGKQDYKLDTLMDRDGLAVEAYGVTSLPLLVVIDKQGVVRASHSGGGESVLEGLRVDLEAILAGKPTPATTQP